jgi:hypothetical protein
MTNPTITPEELEAAARAMFPTVFEAWQARYDYTIKEGGTPEKAKEFADWCDKGGHPYARVSFAREAAKAAITAFLEVRGKKGQGDERG